MKSKKQEGGCSEGMQLYLEPIREGELGYQRKKNHH